MTYPATASGEGTASHSTAEMNQRSFASAEYATKKKRTRREKFLGDMERVMPWSRLIGVIESLDPTRLRGASSARTIALGRMAMKRRFEDIGEHLDLALFHPPGIASR